MNKNTYSNCNVDFFSKWLQIWINCYDSEKHYNICTIKQILYNPRADNLLNSSYYYNSCDRFLHR